MLQHQILEPNRDEIMLEAMLSLRAETVKAKDHVAICIGRIDELIDQIYTSQGMNPTLVACARATRIVQTWPEWKQNVLANSGKSTLDTPRTPVDNFSASDPH